MFLGRAAKHADNEECSDHGPGNHRVHPAADASRCTPCSVIMPSGANDGSQSPVERPLEKAQVNDLPIIQGELVHKKAAMVPSG